ncbi:MAG: MATE family efflux transporter [Bacteroidales bacterium]|jgi:putative MATE family efflux protein|nr:MATE family efflux transporter [Bacteroidales bacterium]
MLDFTKGNAWKLLLQFSAPMFIGNILMQFYHVADTYIVGNFLGTKALAAVGASGPVIFALVSFIIGIAIGCTIIISQYFGNKNIEKVRRAIDTVIVFVIVAAMLIMLVGMLMCDPLLRLVKTPDDVMEGARVFYQIIVIGILPLFGINVLSAILRGLGDSKTPLYYMIASSLLNLLLLVLFVPFLHWGIAGAAWATIFAQLLTVVVMIVQLRKHEIIRIAFRPKNFDFDIFRQSVRIGLPNGIQQALVAIGMMALLSIVNDFKDSNLLAAYSIAGRIDSLASAPAMTFSVAIAAFVGQNVGARKLQRVSEGLSAALFISSGLSVAISLVMILFRYEIMRWFATDAAPEVIELGSRYLLIIGMFYTVFSVMFVFNGVMRGAGDTLVPMFITLLSLWLVRVPFASVMSGHIGPDGVWWSIPAGWCVGMICAVVYYRIGRWKNKGVIRPEELNMEDIDMRPDKIGI